MRLLARTRLLDQVARADSKLIWEKQFTPGNGFCPAFLLESASSSNVPRQRNEVRRSLAPFVLRVGALDSSAWIFPDWRQIVFMKTPLFCALAAVAFATGCGDKNSGTTQSASTNSTDSSVDYLGGLARSKQSADKTIETASINQAIQMFQVDKGRLPKDLDELVKEKYLPQLPKPPHGMKFDYDAITGVVKVVPE